MVKVLRARSLAGIHAASGNLAWLRIKTNGRPSTALGQQLALAPSYLRGLGTGPDLAMRPDGKRFLAAVRIRVPPRRQTFLGGFSQK